MNILMKKPRLQTHLPDIPLLILSRWEIRIEMLQDLRV